MIFEYHSNIFRTRYTFFVLEIVAQASFFRRMKTDQGRMRCDVERSKVFHIIDTVCLTSQPRHSYFCCWLLPIWPKLDVYTINNMKLFRTLHITPHPALVCFHQYKKSCLSYNLQYKKCIPCPKNIWMIFEYHDDNYAYWYLQIK